MDTIQLRVQVSRYDIALLCNFIAGYEGVAIVRTLDASQGLVELLVAPAFYATVLTILQELRQEMPLCLV